MLKHLLMLVGEMILRLHQAYTVSECIACQYRGVFNVETDNATQTFNDEYETCLLSLFLSRTLFHYLLYFLDDDDNNKELKFFENCKVKIFFTNDSLDSLQLLHNLFIL